MKTVELLQLRCSVCQFYNWFLHNVWALELVFWWIDSFLFCELSQQLFIRALQLVSLRMEIFCFVNKEMKFLWKEDEFNFRTRMKCFCRLLYRYYFHFSGKICIFQDLVSFFCNWSGKKFWITSIVSLEKPLFGSSNDLKAPVRK